MFKKYYNNNYNKLQKDSIENIHKNIKNKSNIIESIVLFVPVIIY
jgi:hypothetical protein